MKRGKQVIRIRGRDYRLRPVGGMHLERMSELDARVDALPDEPSASSFDEAARVQIEMLDLMLEPAGDGKSAREHLTSLWEAGELDALKLAEFTQLTSRRWRG